MISKHNFTVTFVFSLDLHQFFSKGQCRNGALCRFSHDPSAPPMDENDSQKRRVQAPPTSSLPSNEKDAKAGALPVTPAIETTKNELVVNAAKKPSVWGSGVPASIIAPTAGRPGGA